MTSTDEVRIVVALTTQEIRRLGRYVPILVISHEAGSLALEVNDDDRKGTEKLESMQA